MQSGIKLYERFTRALFGKPEEYDLQHRFFNASCLTGSIAGILATLINLFLNINLTLTLSTTVLSLIFLVFYYISLKKKKYKSIILPYIFISLLALTYIWFINSGSGGPVIYVLIIVLFIYTVLTDGSNRTIALIIVLVTVSVLFIYEYLHPELILPYADRESRFYDLFFTALFSMGLVAIVASFIMKNYHDEREMVLKQRDKILNQNKEINFHKENLEELVKKRTSELEETNVQLQKAKEKAEESDRLKSAFLSNMSHEIRTPMNAIIGFAELLKEPDISKEMFDKYIDIITSKGNLLLNIINDIIDISKVEADKIEINRSVCNVSEMMDELFATFHKTKSLAGKSDIELKLVKPITSKELVLFTDTFRLKQVLSNLIDNAIKFTHRGFIEIGYSVVDVAKEKSIKFYVKDTGLGISDEHLDIIFNRFRQIDDSHTREFGGTGLGLTISKRLVELLEGELSLESEIGVGSTFFFTIPFKQVKATDKPDEQRKSGKMNFNWKDKLILIVEDNYSSFLLFENYLLNTGAKILQTINGKEAVEICKSNHNIDLVLMDIELPGMNGYQATELIKKHRKDLPVISQTAYAMAEDAFKSIKAGCDDHLVKPISKETLLSVLSKYLD